MRRLGWKSACKIEILCEVSEKYSNMKEKRADFYACPIVKI